MHENRETSEAPAAQPGSRSASEGKSRTARAYVSEESHGGIVPMNHSNQDGNSLAENGEGRTPSKENVRQSNTYPTQSGKGVSQGLASVRKAARETKEMKFTALLHHLTVDPLICCGKAFTPSRGKPHREWTGLLGKSMKTDWRIDGSIDRSSWPSSSRSLSSETLK